MSKRRDDDEPVPEPRRVKCIRGQVNHYTYKTPQTFTRTIAQRAYVKLLDEGDVNERSAKFLSRVLQMLADKGAFTDAELMELFGTDHEPSTIDEGPQPYVEKERIVSLSKAKADQL